MELLTKKKEIVSAFLKSNVLVSRALLERLNDSAVVDSWHDALSKGRHPAELLSPQSVSGASSVKVLTDYDELPKKRSVQDFIDYFNARFRAMEKLLQSRSDLQNLTSIARLRGKKEREIVSIIGIVADKHTTKNDHLVLKLEDASGSFRVMFSKSKTDVYQQALDVVFDEVVGIKGTLADNIIFADSLVIPDIPIAQQKTSPDDAHMAVLSCVHVGSAGFESEKFEKFIQWTRGEYGTDEEKEMAKKLKYLFVCGDVVDGVGIYPGQEDELSITNIKGQYEECARLLSRLPKELNIIIGPGNHDVGRISEPQPKLMKEYALPLWQLPNVTMVCNPCMVNIHASNDFSGFDVLMYHGYSFDDYGECVPSIKNSGKHLSDRAVLIMRFLLQRRHLAPQHTSNLYIPDPRYDPLVIDKIPDLFIAGHIHKAGTLNYRSASLVAGSCFQKKTDFQEKVGHEPEPGVVPVMNLQSRTVHMLKL